MLKLVRNLQVQTLETVENMAEWGLKLGLCFQLMDDLIDITGDTETLGKPAGSDVVQGKEDLDCYTCIR